LSALFFKSILLLPVFGLLVPPQPIYLYLHKLCISAALLRATSIDEEPSMGASTNA
jgi:hypothetical protein